MSFALVSAGAVNYEGEIEGEGHRDFEPEVRLDESADHIIVEVGLFGLLSSSHARHAYFLKHPKSPWTW